jgi:hypothetical protein
MEKSSLDLMNPKLKKLSKLNNFMVQKNTLKYIIDIGLLISFLLVTITGIIKFKSFLSLFGISINYQEIPIRILSQMHDWAGLAMAIIVLIHLIENWEWITVTTKQIFKKS